MEDQIGIEVRTVEGVDERGVLLGDMAVAEVLAHDGTVLGFGQGVVIGLA